MEIIPTLKTERLELRPFRIEDAKWVELFAGEKVIADNTLFIPHPYPEDLAELWISTHKKLAEDDKEIVWAVTGKSDGEFIGAIGLELNLKYNKGESGYWIGIPYWNKGFATEALASIIKFGFEILKLNKISAHHFSNNAASGKVMLNNGMQKEGYLREEIIKNGKYIDVICYSILSKDYFKNRDNTDK
ncbi:MAG: GNAT family N-acetyltransferase [Melioribacteraceae bacterium]|nr:GNAT family N-acetyltransferase [Melioribacteraceae bacterium]MCF8356371.1 GNAT family N-acetyltransferase [Melioribacteraceae bacterium]MCF8392261.1 GNAT family N-acetyltransferase [Melioribacteraceae bacterium]MCF8417593.1 GNAT family N-acetyltransferase [Melioribacteraceae bacterium]